MKRKVLSICLAIAVLVLALGLMLYPIISVMYNERHQAQIHTAYQEEVEQVDTSAIKQAKELAIAYNEALVPGVQMSDAYSNEAILQAAEDYKSQLDLTGRGIMGYVQIPTIQVHLPIFHGTADSTLERGVGHLLGSSLPIGGANTHTVLTAHSGMASNKLFSDLDVLEIGDVFYLEVLGEKLAYQVDQIKTVLPHDTTYLGISQGEDYCTLVTCTPFGVNTHRLLVRGVRIPYEEAEAVVEEHEQREQKTESTWEQEYEKAVMIAIGVVIVIGIIIFIIWLFRRYQNETVA